MTMLDKLANDDGMGVPVGLLTTAIAIRPGNADAACSVQSGLFQSTNSFSAAAPGTSPRPWCRPERRVIDVQRCFDLLFADRGSPADRYGRVQMFTWGAGRLA